MVLGSYLMGLFVEVNQSKIPLYLAIIMFVMNFVYVYRMIIAKNKNLLLYVRYGVLISIFIILGIFAILANNNTVFYKVVGIGYAIALIADRSFSLAHHHRARNIFLAVVIYCYSVLLICFFITPVNGGDSISIQYVLIPLTLVFISFIDAMKLVFSGLRKQTLAQIIKKTYTIEILYGLITLIVATSILLMMIEDCFDNYGDALWYCFAVVTTIGFGDYTCVTIIGRVLSVVLGIYGIIVVALITSIIVNFYNESSSSHKDDVITNEVKKLDEERKTVENEEDNKE